MTHDIDYLNLELPPDDKDPKDYTYAERRREEIEYIKKYQDPDLVPRSKLADKYDVSRPQITYDFQILKEYLDKHGGKVMGQRVKIFLDNIFEDMIKKKVKKGEMTGDELKELYDYGREHADWLMQLGRIEKAPNKHEIKHDADDEIKDKTDELIKLVREDKSEEDAD